MTENRRPIVVTRSGTALSWAYTWEGGRGVDVPKSHSHLWYLMFSIAAVHRKLKNTEPTARCLGHQAWWLQGDDGRHLTGGPRASHLLSLILHFAQGQCVRLKAVMEKGGWANQERQLQEGKLSSCGKLLRECQRRHQPPVAEECQRNVRVKY